MAKYKLKKYKLKTHKGAQRRFHITGTGKLLRAKGHNSHLRRKKPKSVKRQYHDMQPMSKADSGRIKKLVPYGIPD